MKNPAKMSEQELRREVIASRSLLSRWLRVTHLGDASVIELREDTREVVDE